MTRILIGLVIVAVAGAAVYGGMKARDADENADLAVRFQQELAEVQEENEALLEQTDLLGEALDNARGEAEAGGAEANSLRKSLNKVRRELRAVRSKTAQLRGRASGCREAIAVVEALQSHLVALGNLAANAIEAAANGNRVNGRAMIDDYRQISQQVTDTNQQFEAAATTCNA